MARRPRTRLGRPVIRETHPDRVKIEYELARGVPTRVVARKYNLAPSTAVRWLRKLPPQLRAAALTAKIVSADDLEKLRLDESNGLLTNLAMQRARLLIVQDRCLEVEDHHLMVGVSNQIHKNIELTGKYLGEFAHISIASNVNVLIQPEYLELRGKIVRALAPFPEARRAVAEVLHQIEGRAANPANANASTPAQAPMMIEAKAEEPSDAA